MLKCSISISRSEPSKKATKKFKLKEVGYSGRMSTTLHLDLKLLGYYNHGSSPKLAVDNLIENKNEFNKNYKVIKLVKILF